VTTAVESGTTGGLSLTSSSVTLTNNRIHGGSGKTAYGALLSAAAVTAYNNYLTPSGGSELAYGLHGTDSSAVARSAWFNNIIDAGTGGGSRYVVYDAGFAPTAFGHNDLVADAASVAAVLYRTASGENLVDIEKVNALGAGYTKNISAAPLFGDPAAFDYHLQSGSPCIDAGLLEGAPALDMDTDERPSGLGVDIGPDEAP